MNDRNIQVIRGYVRHLPRSRDKEDAARVALVAEDGTEYHVAHKGPGSELAANVSANVEVTGQVHSVPVDGEDHRLLLTVRSYRLTDGFDDPWYDDDTTN